MYLVIDIVPNFVEKEKKQGNKINQQIYIAILIYSLRNQIKWCWSIVMKKPLPVRYQVMQYNSQSQNTRDVCMHNNYSRRKMVAHSLCNRSDVKRREEQRS